MKLSQILFSNALLIVAFSASASELQAYISQQSADFQSCLVQKKEEAIRAGVSEERANQEFPNFNFIPRVIELDRSQPEFVSTFPTYFSKRVNQWRIDKGREKHAEHKAFLRSLTNKYGVPSHYLIAYVRKAGPAAPAGINSLAWISLSPNGLPSALVTPSADHSLTLRLSVPPRL